MIQSSEFQAFRDLACAAIIFFEERTIESADDLAQNMQATMGLVL